MAYDPKVVTIWEGMRRYFHEEAHLPVEVILFQSYEMQVAALLSHPGDPTPRIDIAWNTNLAYLQAETWNKECCSADRDARHGYRLDNQNRSGHRRPGRFAGGSQKSHLWLLAAATAVMLPFCQPIFYRAKV